LPWLIVYKQCCSIIFMHVIFAHTNQSKILQLNKTTFFQPATFDFRLGYLTKSYQIVRDMNRVLLCVSVTLNGPITHRFECGVIRYTSSDHAEVEWKEICSVHTK
jgi:hypothetical protein